jgi:xanthine dehydrogenase molybdenum-binding subunit
VAELNFVGKRMPKSDARDKVTGRAVYINDFTRPGMLYGASNTANTPMPAS